ncbi:MAG: SGNH/GDSL hydrolase family protein [Candidatus Lernaella stagnicola]|nr:SGNH/GDSL hydrolase family protein [Candidatus Lernaella stagnicola]
MPDPHAISHHKRVFAAVAALLVVFVVVGAGEMLARTQPPVDVAALTTPGEQPHPMRGWAFVHPYAAYVNRPLADPQAKKSVNRFGFISTPQMEEVAKPAGRIRVAFLGGSSTAGTGTLLADKDTWPYLTYQRMKEARPDLDLEMINAAVGGYTSFDSYGRLWSQVRFFAPDIIVVYHGWNEMYYFDDASPEKIIHRRFEGDRDWSFTPVKLPPRLKPWPTDSLLSRSRLYGLLRLRTVAAPAATTGEAGDERRPDAELADHFDARGVEVFRQNLLLMQRVAELTGADFYVAKQATLVHPSLPEEIRRERVFTWRHAFNYATHLQAWQAINEMIDAAFPAERVIDCTPLSGNPALLFDHIHPTPQGTREIAKIVAGKLLAESQTLRR